MSKKTLGISSNYDNQISTAEDSLNNTANNIDTNTDTKDINTKSVPIENKVSEFTTTIYNKEEGRQNNIRLSTSAINNQIVNSGDTFSFTSVNGQANASNGYMESDVFNSEGEKVRGYGGGVCQVSTTLYNAVLKVDGLEIVERHPHSNTVPYIESGYDAAVAYGSIDLKFKNTTGKSIKIYASTSGNDVTVSLVSIN